MRIACYLRRSTEEHQVESLSTQEESAARFARSISVGDGALRVFSDDAKSRAEFQKRQGLIALLNAAKAGELDVVITRDGDRLGGDMLRTGLAIADLLDSGVRLFYYATAEEVRLDNSVDKFMLSARNFASELEREKIVQRTREHLENKARRGLNVGGRVYGYDNVEVEKSERGRRVDYRINPEQAEVVREIFRRYAEGEGVRGIAKAFNERGIPPPRAGKRGTGSWAPSAMWAMVHSERYRGVLVWGRKGRRYRHGTREQFSRNPDELVRVERPELRIIDEALWSAVRVRAERNHKFRGQRNRSGGARRYLLTGLSRCAECGGPICATTGKSSYRTIRVYTCMWHRDRGSAVCSNTLHRETEVIDAAVANWISEHVLSEKTVARIFARLRHLVADGKKTSDSETPKMETEARALKVEITRLANALASTDEKPDSIVRAIAERERRMEQLRGRIEAVKAAPSVLDIEIGRMEKAARLRLSDLRGLLVDNPQEGRKALEALLDEPLKLRPVETPEGKRFQIEGNLTVGTLLIGEDAVTLNQIVTPTGFEPMYPA